MASPSSMEKNKEYLNSQIYDDEKWSLDSKLLCAVGLFSGSILFMCNFGGLMAI